MKAPDDFIGKNLRTLDLRAKYGLNVIAIKKESINKEESEEKIDISPVPDRAIEKDDILVLIGSNQNIDNIKKTHK
jgi:trk system potassium uptake protein TrkA